MRIVVFSFACDPTAGSEPSHGFHLPAGLARAGHQVVCLTQSRGRRAIEAELSTRPLPGLTFVYVDLSTQWQKFYYNTAGLYLFYLNWQRKAADRASELDAEQPFDLGHHITWGSLQLGTGLALLDIPYVFGPVGGGQHAPPAFKKYFGGEWRKEVMRRITSQVLVATNPLLRRTLRNDRALVLASNDDTMALARKLGARRVVEYADVALPTSFWPDEAPAPPESPTLRLIWTGRLLPRKGVMFLLEALTYLPTDLDWSLTIVGDGPQGGQLPGWLEEYGLTGQVKWVGRIPWEQVPAAYAAHDAFIFTSLRDSIGMQLLEAMAFGLPIITLALHGGAAVAPEGASYKVPVTTPEETARCLAEAIVTHAARRAEWPAMRARAREHGLQYLWPAKLAFYEECYRTLTVSSKG